MGKLLVIKGADFRANSLNVSVVDGTPNYVLSPGIGGGRFELNNEGFCLLPTIMSPIGGQFALGTYGTENHDITRIKACWNVEESGITSFQQLFCYFTDATEIDCNSLKPVGITDFAHAFNSCEKVTRIDISNWDSNEQNASVAYMFSYCFLLQWVDLGKIIIPSSTTSVFVGCVALQKVRTHRTETENLNAIRTVLNAASAGGSTNWVQGVDSDGCIMFTH